MQSPSVLSNTGSLSGRSVTLKQILRHPKSLLELLPPSLANPYKQMLFRRGFKLHSIPPSSLAIPEPYQSSLTTEQLPSIAIVTPSYNQGNFIERTIQSVLNQEYPRLEYIVQDGASNDESVSVIKRYEDRLAFWESKPDGGQSAAINLGLKRSNAEILAYLNSDDALLPGALHYVAEFFHKHPEVDVVYGNRILIDEHDRIGNYWVLPPFDSQIIKWFDFIPQETMFWRRRAWDAVGSCIDEKFNFAMDWDLILRFVAAKMNICGLPRFLGAFRVTETQKTSCLWESVGKREAQGLRERELGVSPTDREIQNSIRAYLNEQTRVERLFNLRSWISKGFGRRANESCFLSYESPLTSKCL